MLRRDIVDRNGVLISRNIKSYHAAINPNLIIDKDNFLIKLRINFPEIPIKRNRKENKKRKIFLFKKRINQIDKERLWSRESNNIRALPN